MPGHCYQRIVVQGGNVQAGDRYEINKYLVLDESSSVDVRNLLNDLAALAQFCNSISTNIISIGSPTLLKELVHDVTDLQSAMGNLQILMEDQIEDVQSMAPACQKHLTDLCLSMNAYKGIVASIQQETNNWCTSTRSDTSKDAVRPSPADIFAIRERLSRVRRKLNLTVSIVNWSSMQSFRQQSSQQFHDLLQHLIAMADQLENERVKDLPASLPLSQTNVLPLSQEDHSNDYLRDYLNDGSSDGTIRSPSMQVSILGGSSRSDTCTFVSAAERFVVSIHRAKDDLDVEHEPSSHVDYLSHEWEQQDIWSSWRYVVARRNKITNCERLENAAWRTWTKTKYDLKTTSPDSLNWMKDCDHTWLYGPLQVDTKKGFLRDPTSPPSHISTSLSFLNKKPILKKRLPSVPLLEKSLNEHTLLQRAGEIIQVQQSGHVLTHPSLRKGRSDFSLPSFRSGSALNTSAEGSNQSGSTTRASFGAQTPFEAKHVFFNEEVRQVQAIDSEDDEKEDKVEDDMSESDEEDDGWLLMAPARSRSNRITERSSFSKGIKTITPLPPTTLKARNKTSEPQNATGNSNNLFIPQRGLQHSSSPEI